MCGISSRDGHTGRRQEEIALSAVLDQLKESRKEAEHQDNPVGVRAISGRVERATEGTNKALGPVAQVGELKCELAGSQAQAKEKGSDKEDVSETPMHKKEQDEGEQTMQATKTKEKLTKSASTETLLAEVSKLFKDEQLEEYSELPQCGTNAATLEGPCTAEAGHIISCEEQNQMTDEEDFEALKAVLESDDDVQKAFRDLYDPEIVEEEQGCDKRPRSPLTVAVFLQLREGIAPKMEGLMKHKSQKSTGYLSTTSGVSTPTHSVKGGPFSTWNGCISQSDIMWDGTEWESAGALTQLHPEFFIFDHLFPGYTEQRSYFEDSLELEKDDVHDGWAHALDFTEKLLCDIESEKEPGCESGPCTSDGCDFATKRELSEVQADEVTEAKDSSPAHYESFLSETILMEVIRGEISPAL